MRVRHNSCDGSKLQKASREFPRLWEYLAPSIPLRGVLANRLVSSVLLGCSEGTQLAECLKSVDVASSITPELWLELHSLGQC